MKWPIRITRIEHGSVNYHGPGGKPLHSCLRVWRLDCHVWAWKPSVYNRDGHWWHFDIFFPWFRRR